MTSTLEPSVIPLHRIRTVSPCLFTQRHGIEKGGFARPKRVSPCRKGQEWRKWAESRCSSVEWKERAGLVLGHCGLGWVLHSRGQTKETYMIVCDAERLKVCFKRTMPSHWSVSFSWADDLHGLTMSMCGTEVLEGQSPVAMVMCFVPQSRAVSVKTDIIAHRRK